MDQTSILKIIKAGFIIIRKDDYPNIRIKYMDNNCKNWSTLNQFKSKAARDREFTELMKLEKFISEAE